MWWQSGSEANKIAKLISCPISGSYVVRLDALDLTWLAGICSQLSSDPDFELTQGKEV